MSQTVDSAAAEHRQLRLRAAYATVFGGPEGTLVLHDMLRAGGLLAVSHTPGAPDETAFREGRRSVALHLLDMLRWSEAELAKLSRQRTAEAVAPEAAEPLIDTSDAVMTDLGDA